jgi:hypothetical protein
MYIATEALSAIVKVWRDGGRQIVRTADIRQLWSIFDDIKI